jgi:hypothetical protein
MPPQYVRESRFGKAYCIWRATLHRCAKRRLLKRNTGDDLLRMLESCRTGCTKTSGESLKGGITNRGPPVSFPPSPLFKTPGCFRDALNYGSVLEEVVSRLLPDLSNGCLMILPSVAHYAVMIREEEREDLRLLLSFRPTFAAFQFSFANASVLFRWLPRLRRCASPKFRSSANAEVGRAHISQCPSQVLDRAHGIGQPAVGIRY